MPLLTGAYVESRLINLLIEIEVRQFDRPLCKERSVHGIHRQLDGIYVRQIQPALGFE